MPPVEAASYLLAYLFGPGELGLTMQTAMGPGPITHGELRKWMKNTCTRLLPWECRLLVRLSREYLAALQRAEKRDAKIPWGSPDAEPLVTDTQRSLRALAEASA